MDERVIPGPDAATTELVSTLVWTCRSRIQARGLMVVMVRPVKASTRIPAGMGSCLRRRYLTPIRSETWLNFSSNDPRRTEKRIVTSNGLQAMLAGSPSTTTRGAAGVRGFHGRLGGGPNTLGGVGHRP